MSNSQQTATVQRGPTRAEQILTVLGKEPMTPSQIKKALGWDKSVKAFRLLADLAAKGKVQRHGDGRNTIGWSLPDGAAPAKKKAKKADPAAAGEHVPAVKPPAKPKRKKAKEAEAENGAARADAPAGDEDAPLVEDAAPEVVAD